MLATLESIPLHDVQPAVVIAAATAASGVIAALWRDRQKGIEREQKNLVAFMEAQAKHNQSDRDHVDSMRDLTSEIRRMRP